MNKKIIIGIVIVIILVVLGIGGYYLMSNNNKDTIINNKGKDSDIGTNKRILVVYYSATGSTERVAKEMANILGADIFEIEPKEEYTSSDLNWSSSDSRVTREHNDESLRNVELKSTIVDDFDSYDTILIGYPIWWGIAAWPVNTFVKANDFTGKTVIPFCTSASSGLGNSGKLLEDLAGTGNWQEGYRFSSSATDADIKSFTDSLK